MASISERREIRETETAGPAPALQSIIEAFREINNQNEFGSLTNKVLQQMSRLFQAEAAVLLLVNKAVGNVEIAAVYQVPEEIIAAYMKNPARANELAGAIRHEAVDSLAAAGYPHFKVIPIRSQSKIIGYLTLAAVRPLLSSPESQEKLSLFLEYITQAIENAYLIFQLRQQNARLELMMTRLQNTQNHLKRAEKMALVGKLATTIAHEIRNPLTIVGTSLQLVFDKMEPDHSDKGLYETMINKVRAVDQTIKEMMILARPLQLRLKAVNIEHTLDRMRVFVSRKYQARGLSISTQIPDDLPLAYLDEEQIQRVIINLLLNAYNFLPDNGCLKVRAWHDAGQPWISLELSDNGRGIPPEHLDHIFEPFFTTRAEGTGLGLFLVKHILEEMNGAIEVHSEPAQGATFTLRLPLAE